VPTRSPGTARTSRATQITRGGASAAFAFVFTMGIFYTGYGGGWLIGSIATGLLYRVSVASVIAFSMVVQLGAIPIILFARHVESGRDV
jgi:hypothetical protein